MDVNPDPLPTGSSGTPITAYVRVPGPERRAGARLERPDHARSPTRTSRPTRDFRNTGWTVSNGVGTAKFDRQKLVQYLGGRNIHNRVGLDHHQRELGRAAVELPGLGRRLRPGLGKGEGMT